MSELKKNIIIYVQSALFFICLIIPGLEIVYDMGIFRISRFYFGCYCFMFLMIRLVLSLVEKDKMAIWLSVLTAGIIMAIFRDVELIENIIIALLFFLLFYLFVIKKIDRFGWIVVAVLMLGFWMKKGMPPKIVSVCLFVSLIYGIMKLTDNMSEYYSFVILLIGMLTLCIPAKDTPIQWNGIKRTITFVRNSSFRIVSEAEYFLEGLTDFNGAHKGYSDIGRLTGRITGKGREELIVRSSGQNKCRYLSGGVYKTLTVKGMTDKESMIETGSEWFVDYINSLYRADINKYEAACFSRIEKMDIEYRYIHTRDIFVPERFLYYNNDIPSSGNKYGRGFSYSVDYMAIDYASPYYLKVIDSAASGDMVYVSYEEIKDYVRTIYNIDIKKIISKEDYDRVVSCISDSGTFEEYLDTSLLKPEIQELTSEVTKDAKTDYEKAKAIETYLRGYKYDTSVDLKDSDNYVESFLFESCSGYCIHYASAMVLMLRSAGIPSRYISGFLKPDNHKQEKEEIISGDSAHAWVEAYLKGIGWIRLEPTRIMRRAEGITWGLEIVSTEETSGDILENYQAGFDQGQYYIEEHHLAENDEIPLNTVSKTSARDSELKFYLRVFFRFGRYILIMLGFMMLMLIIYRGARMYLYIKMQPEEKLKENIRIVCRRLDKLMPEGEEADSVMDYLRVIDDDNTRNELRSIFDEYYRVRFRGDAPSEELISRARSFRLEQ